MVGSRVALSVLSCLVVSMLSGIAHVEASVFLPYKNTAKVTDPSSFPSASGQVLDRRARTDFRLALRKRRSPVSSTAMAIPGYGVAEQVFVGGFGNFLTIYNAVITVRILLSWIPQAQGIALLEPVYAITDPFLNLFRGVIPPLFGLDFSPILAFFLLNVLTSATAAVGYEIPPHLQSKIQKQSVFQQSSRSPVSRLFNRKGEAESHVSMNY